MSLLGCQSQIWTSQTYHDSTRLQLLLPNLSPPPSFHLGQGQHFPSCGSGQIPWRRHSSLSSHTPHLVQQQTLLALPSKQTQKMTTLAIITAATCGRCANPPTHTHLSPALPPDSPLESLVSTLAPYSPFSAQHSKRSIKTEVRFSAQNLPLTPHFSQRKSHSPHNDHQGP